MDKLWNGTYKLEVEHFFGRCSRRSVVWIEGGAPVPRTFGGSPSVPGWRSSQFAGFPHYSRILTRFTMSLVLFRYWPRSLGTSFRYNVKTLSGSLRTNALFWLKKKFFFALWKLNFDVVASGRCESDEWWNRGCSYFISPPNDGRTDF